MFVSVDAGCQEVPELILPIGIKLFSFDPTLIAMRAPSVTMTELASVVSVVAGACSVCAGVAAAEGLGVAVGAVVVGSAAGVSVGFGVAGLAGAGRGVAFGAGLEGIVWPSCCATPGTTHNTSNDTSIKT